MMPVASATKPPFDQFHLAMLYEDRRARIGIPIDTVRARELLSDEVALIAFYSAWSPSYIRVRRARRIPPTFFQRVREAIGWAMLLVVTVIGGSLLAVAIAGVVAALVTGGTPGQITLPSIFG